MKLGGSSGGLSVYFILRLFCFHFTHKFKSRKFCVHLGTVYTDAVSFVTALVSMRLHLSFTRRRSSSLSEPGRFENALKSGAFSKRYGFIGRVNGETASI